MKGKIIEAFAALLSNYYFVRDVEKYIVSAIQGIQERKDIGSYFKVIHEALKITERIGIDRINRAIDLA